MSDSQAKAAASNELERFQLYINGEYVAAKSGKTFLTANPYTTENWAEVPDAGTEDVDLAVEAARKAMEGPWGSMSGFQRAKLIRRLGELIDENAEYLARMEVRDSGKLYREMIFQLKYLPEWFNYFSGLADKLEGKTIPTDKNNFFVYTQRHPVGVVAAITPWNAPMMLMAMKLAPALAAGCTFVIKPSEHAPASTLAFGKLVKEAGIPDGVFNVVTGLDRQLGAHLAGHPGVGKVVFTGSTATGRAVAQAAGSQLNGVVLELGGKSPQVVFEDSDPEAVANGVIAGIFAAGGQTCMAGSRLIIHRSMVKDVVDRVVARAKTIKMGDPQADDTEMGPISNKPQFDRISEFLKSADSEGAKVVTGGVDTDKHGWFVKPTVITDVTSDMRVVKEEIFGPVLCVIPFDTEEEAIALANDTEYGLAGSVWTMNIQRAHRVASKLRTGTVWINSYRAVSPSVPFGGFGASGLGRENGVESILDFMETKSVWVELSGATRDPFRMA
ncbi:aldehyde dehydrogenase [Pusillimonas sp. DMV24BSW_D]|uniref:aldehyde dehydrogenase n=1 Tax=Neopusillimonas aestuarii TaxID=2716226 RepID=UPI001409EE09|nr:aldehyde dehydrogenase [Pusillimonas sp. DMV24BSW_D]QIM48803.1 aldehyde dehydrogenase [Pusillimonas sp. DMV24BSW_D]